MDLLGDIHQLEEGGEGPDDLGGCAQVQIFREAGDGRLALERELPAQILSEIPDLLLLLEQRAPRLLDQDRPQQIAEEPDVPPEREVAGGRIRELEFVHTPSTDRQTPTQRCCYRRTPG